MVISQAGHKQKKKIFPTCAGKELWVKLSCMRSKHRSDSLVFGAPLGAGWYPRQIVQQNCKKKVITIS